MTSDSGKLVAIREEVAKLVPVIVAKSKSTKDIKGAKGNSRDSKGSKGRSLKSGLKSGSKGGSKQQEQRRKQVEEEANLKKRCVEQDLGAERDRQQTKQVAQVAERKKRRLEQEQTRKRQLDEHEVELEADTRFGQSADYQIAKNIRGPVIRFPLVDVENVLMSGFNVNLIDETLISGETSVVVESLEPGRHIIRLSPGQAIAGDGPQSSSNFLVCINKFEAHSSVVQIGDDYRGTFLVRQIGNLLHCDCGSRCT